MKTRITELLGIQYPILQGGMAQVAEHHLAAAVSEAGGFGILGAAALPAGAVREEIRKVRELTDKPFGVNIMLMSPYAEEVACMAAEERVAAVTTGAGNPEKYLKKWQDAGVKVTTPDREAFRAATAYLYADPATTGGVDYEALRTELYAQLGITK